MKWLVLFWLSFINLHAAADEAFGRLFFTPKERDSLNQAKQIQEHIVTPIANTEPIKPARANKVQGYVKRNDGQQSTVWVNGKAVQRNIGPHVLFE